MSYYKLGWFDDSTHRELADDVTKFLQGVSFRDVCLFKVFQLGLTTLKQLQTGAIGTFIIFVLYNYIYIILYVILIHVLINMVG